LQESLRIEKSRVTKSTVSHSTHHVKEKPSRHETSHVTHHQSSISTFSYQENFKQLFLLHAKNGSLSVNQFMSFAQSLVKALAGEEMDTKKQCASLMASFKELDTDGSGSIEWDEMLPLV